MRKFLLALLIVFVGVFAVSAIPLHPGGEPLGISAGIPADAVLTPALSMEALQVIVEVEAITVIQPALTLDTIFVYITNIGQHQSDASRPPVNFHLLC
jgi:hypothetical protein